jgi:hypothetical protein
MSRMPSSYALSRTAGAFVIGAVAVLTVHQPLIALLHLLGFTPIAPYSLRATHPWGVPVFLSLSFWGGLWSVPISWILDRLPRNLIYYAAAVCLGALPPNIMTWFVIFPLKGLSPITAGASIGIFNALIVNGLWGLGFALFWSSITRPQLPARFAQRSHPCRSGRAI